MSSEQLIQKFNYQKNITPHQHRWNGTNWFFLCLLEITKKILHLINIDGMELIVRCENHKAKAIGIVHNGDRFYSPSIE
ncbi:hypothetical protein Glove_195g23 [Diversispora epigaea]|uniref:Uncharacterized protein n=1 Tax=Diversispora epigaea TaxID=1348612 RepID=A0A397IKZ6_9GLOM|nr:hypothetical protein Glove_195g23 [Diversispora epigaea]